MSKKLLLVAMGLTIAYGSLTAQAMSGSLTGTFVQGISPVTNTITATALQNTEKTVFAATDSTLATQYGTHTDETASDGFTWAADMGQFPQGTAISAKFYDASNNLLGASDTFRLKVLAKPQWLTNGSASNVVVAGDSISFQGTYPIADFPYTIPTTIFAIGGRSLSINGSIIFDGVFNMTDSSARVNNNNGRIALDVLNQFPLSKDINLPIDATLGKDLNISFVAIKEHSTKPIPINMPKIRFPIKGGTVSIDAGVSLYATLRGQLVVGEQQGRFGFIDNGTTGRTKVTGVLTGEGFVRGTLSLLGGILKATASLKAVVRLGAGFDFISVPSTNLNPLFGGDLKVSGKACVQFSRFLKRCTEDASLYYKQFGNQSVLPPPSRNGLNLFDLNFNTPSSRFSDTGTLALPDFNPQPTFATRGDTLYTVWLEDNNLLFSKLNATGTTFSSQKLIVSNTNFITNPKVGILPNGSAIITWTQNRYNETTATADLTEENLAQAQDIWYAIYDNQLDRVVQSGKLGDDDSSPQSGRAEGEAKVFVGDNDDAMITWISKDAGLSSSDIWFTRLTQASNSWALTTPAKLADLPGTNYNVGVAYSDTANVLAVWINDPDGNEETYDSKIMFSKWNGNTWSSAQILSNNDGSTKFNDISLSANAGFVAAGWTSSRFESNNDFKNRLDMEIYNTATGSWDAGSLFQDVDSLNYFQNPIASISKTGIASICYKVTKMFPDSTNIDNGQLYLYVKNLNTSSNWKEITDNAFLSDTSTFIWSLAAGFSGNSKYFTLTQENGDNGVLSSPRNGVRFGKPNLNMVLRGIQINPNLTVSDIPEPTVPIVIPVELMSFDGFNKGKYNLLKWQTANEINNKGYDVQRSSNSLAFETIGFVKAKGQNSMYEFTDQYPLGISYYRLRQIDIDGKETYSKVVSVVRESLGEITLYPNPTNGKVYIQTTKSQPNQMRVFNSLGQLLIEKQGGDEIDMSNLPRGFYQVELSFDNNTKIQKRVIKN